MTDPKEPSVPIDHRANAERLLTLWAEDRDMDNEMTRWELLTAAQAHATLAQQGSAQEGVALMTAMLDLFRQEQKTAPAAAEEPSASAGSDGAP
jgi:hypothetical protein